MYEILMHPEKLSYKSYFLKNEVLLIWDHFPIFLNLTRTLIQSLISSFTESHLIKDEVIPRYGMNG